MGTTGQLLHDKVFRRFRGRLRIAHHGPADTVTFRPDEDASQALAANEADRAEAMQVLRDMETLRAS